MAKAKNEQEFTTIRVKRTTVGKLNRLAEIVSENMEMKVERYDALDIEVDRIINRTNYKK